MSYTIDKDVPIASGKHKYPFATLKVGDSFLVPMEEIKSVRMAASRASAYGTGKYITRTRNLEEDKEYGVRVWRVE